VFSSSLRRVIPMATKKKAATKKSPPAKKSPAGKPAVKLPIDDDQLLEIDYDLLKPRKPGKPGTNNPGPMFRSEIDIFRIRGTVNPGPMRTPVERIRTRRTDNPGPMLHRNVDDFGIE